MKSRAHMLLEKEYVKLQKDAVWGVDAKPLNDDNFFLWEAKIHGLKDTMWEGGIFKVYMLFDEMYSCAPPKLLFTTIPFHPNVDISSGRPCVDFLDNVDDWKQCYSIGYILLTLQTLLANPVLENAVNHEAASVYKNNPDIYREMALNCVLASKRLDANLAVNVNDNNGTVAPEQLSGESDNQTSTKCARNVSKVSFEDYLTLWKGIATSSPSEMASNPLCEYLKSDRQLQNAHFELSQAELEHEICLQLAEHRRLMYGKFGKEECSRYNVVRDRPHRIHLLKQVRSPRPTTETTSGMRSTSPIDDAMDFDKEAADLVNWTQSLSPEQDNF